MIMFTNTEKASYMKLAKMPRGPTITMKLEGYTLAADVFEFLTENNRTTKPLTKSFDHVPLVIMNGFNNTGIPEQHKMAIDSAGMLIQSLFPPLNLNELQLKSCKRVVLFNLNLDDPESPSIEFRHFDIDIEKHSIKKTISNIINSKKTDLSKFKNISDYVLQQSGYTSCSDNEEGGIVDTVEKKGDNKVKTRLHEIGPKINMKIVKIEEGFLKGNVIYHSYIHKTKKEIKEVMAEIREKKRLKKERKTEQEQNVQKKQEEAYNKLTDEQKEELEKSKFELIFRKV
jgi:ribosome biogenesis protein SSF1/2